MRLIYPFKRIGYKRLPKKDTYVSISNHLSAKDIIMLELYLPGFRYTLAKKELSGKGFKSFILDMLGAIYIDRNSLDVKAIKECIAKVKKHPLAIFPEGTRNKTGEGIQEVKGGAAMIAAKAGVDIVPIMFHHKTKAFKRNYMFIGERITLPFGPKDRFNNEAMSMCTTIISQKMNEAKETLDNLVKTNGIKAYNKELKIRLKAEKNAAKNAKKESAKQTKEDSSGNGENIINGGDINGSSGGEQN